MVAKLNLAELQQYFAQKRQDFPFLQLAKNPDGRPIVYLDNAATSLRPQVMIDAITNYYTQETANIHRGAHFLAEAMTAKYEEARSKAQQLLNARSPQEIIFTRGTTESINLVAHCWAERFLRPGDEIIISGMEHHSNIVPWQQVCQRYQAQLKIIPVLASGELDLDSIPFSEKSKLLAINHVSNVLGTVNPIGKILQQAKARGIYTLVDSAQAIAHFPIDVQALNCDFLAFSGHKIYGPSGIGILYGKESILDEIPPYQFGGSMIKTVSFSQTTFNDLPYKFEAGTPHIAGAVGLLAAINYLQSIDWEKLAAFDHAIQSYTTTQLQQFAGIKIIGNAQEKCPIISFVWDQIHAQDISFFLDQKGIAIRSGHLCATPLLTQLHIPALARVSLSFYNTFEEIDYLISTLKQAQEFFA